MALMFPFVRFTGDNIARKKVPSPAVSGPLFGRPAKEALSNFMLGLSQFGREKILIRLSGTRTSCAFECGEIFLVGSNSSPGSFYCTT